MPAKPTPKQLAITGESAMMAVHAVVDLATCPADRSTRSQMRGQLAQLVRDISLAPDADDADPAYRALTVTLARLLHRSVERLMARVGRPDSSAEDMLRYRLRREDPAIQGLAVQAHGLSVAEFIAAIGYGTETPVDPVEVGVAGAAALRALLHDYMDGDVPQRQWAVIARVTNAVMALHYRQ